MNNICVYRHIKPCGEVFYVGIGNNKRPYEKRHRNNMWLKTINKYSNYKIEILYNNLDLESAKELEIFLIELYGRKCNKSGTLCNITLGGEGAFGLKHSKESLVKMSNSRKGMKAWNKNINLSENHKLNLKLNSGQAKKVINTETGEIYNSGAECARINNIVYVTLQQQLNGIRKNKTKFKFIENGK